MSRTSARSVAGPSRPGVAAWPAGWASAAAGLLAVGAAAAFLHRDAIAAAVAIWVGSPTYSYGMLVPPVAVWLAWRQRDALRAIAPRPWTLGLVALGGAVLVATVGQVVSALVVEQLALAAILQAAALTILGPRAFRLLAFPLFYLYLAVPVGDGLIAPLQELTARVAVGALEFAGVPVRLNGLLIEIPSATFHVAEACAGLRFLLASFAVGLLLAYLFFPSWRRSRLAFVALSIVLPIVGNALRAAGVVLIAHLSDARSALGFDHLTYGYLFTAVLLGSLVGLAALLGSPRRVAVPVGQPLARGSGVRIPAIAGMALLITALPMLAARPAAEPCPLAPALDAPAIAAPWSPTNATSDWRPIAANPDAELRHSYRRGEARVDLYVAYYCAQREGAEGVSQAHGLTGGGHWLVQAQRRVRLHAGESQLAVQVTEMRFAGQRRLVMVWYWVDGRFTADPLAAKLLQAKAAILGGPAAAAVIVVSTPYGSDASAARSTVDEALAALEPMEDVLARAAATAD